MSTPPNIADVTTRLSSLVATIDNRLKHQALGRAAQLARRGQWHEAEQTLRQCETSDASSVESLDLLARIRLQQGRFGEAETLWLRAAELAPGTEMIAQALAAVRRAQRRKVYWGWQRFWPLPLVMAMVWGGVWLGVRQARMEAVSTAAQKTQSRLLESELQQLHQAARQQVEQHAQIQRLLTSESVDLAGRINAIAAEQAAGKESSLRFEKALIEALASNRAPTPAPASELAQKLALLERSNQVAVQNQIAGQIELRNELAAARAELASLGRRLEPQTTPQNKTSLPDMTMVGGVKSVREGEKLLVWFSNGIFQRGLPWMKLGSEETFRGLARALQQAREIPLRVEVIGSAVEGSLFSAPDMLAHKRAAIVAQRVASMSGLPVQRIVSRAATSAEVADQMARAANSAEAGSVIVSIELMNGQRP